MKIYPSDPVPLYLKKKVVAVFSTHERLSVFLCLAVLCAKDYILDLVANSRKRNSEASSSDFM